MGNKLKIQSTAFDGLFVIEPLANIDDRGIFSRVFCTEELKNIFKEKSIKQINHSITAKKGTVRGMHFQYAPDCEVKMVTCLRGEVYDVVVDIREDSKTFLKIFSVELSAENKKIIFIPEGFAHAFQTLEDDSELLYLHSNIYTPDNEGGINCKDPSLNIEWPLEITDISKRDEEHKFLDDSFKGIRV